jgi:ATP-dependent protease ClpP protease subunit
MNELEFAKTAWRSRWEARRRVQSWRPARAAAPPAPEIRRVDVDCAVPVVDEGQCDRLKAAWRARHRWRAPPADICVSLTGDVSDGSVDEIIAAIAQDPAAPIFLTITSRGGCPLAAVRLYDALRAHCAPVTVHVPARCSSAALVCLMGGDVRQATPSAQFMAHTAAWAVPRTGRHTAEALRQSAAELAEIDAEMSMIIGLRSRYPAWQLRRDMQEERTLDAAEAWRLGLINEAPNDC